MRQLNCPDWFSFLHFDHCFFTPNLKRKQFIILFFHCIVKFDKCGTSLRNCACTCSKLNGKYPMVITVCLLMSLQKLYFFLLCEECEEQVWEVKIKRYLQFGLITFLLTVKQPLNFFLKFSCFERFCNFPSISYIWCEQF